MPRLIDMTGQAFGRLTVMGRAAGPRTKWLCSCSCGQTKAVAAFSLRRGDTRSCGCLKLEMYATGSARLRHGMAGSNIYRAWNTMLGRCNNPRRQRFADYGARGIKVCKRWHKFENFYADMGPRPSPRHSLDRIDNDGNYGPSNCRWALAEQQSNNRRTVLKVTHEGRTQSSAWWARKLGVPDNTFRRRIRDGWAVDQIVAAYRSNQDDTPCMAP